MVIDKGIPSQDINITWLCDKHERTPILVQLIISTHNYKKHSICENLKRSARIIGGENQYEKELINKSCLKWWIVAQKDESSLQLSRR